MRVIIVEDEELASRELRNMLQQVTPSVEVHARLETVQSAVAWLQAHDVDLIFMDIHLGDGNSFQIFEQIDINIPVIFTTAFDTYALESYRHFGIDYLLKPFDLEDVQAAVDKVQLLITSAKLRHERLEVSQVQERFMVSVGTRLKTIPMGEVAYFMAEGKHLFLISVQGQKYLLNDTLAGIEARLSPREFFRINRKFIVGYASIREMAAYTRGRVRVRLDPEPPINDTVLVSSERGKLFRRWLSR